MPLKLQTLRYDPERGHDVMATLADIKFDPRKCLTREEAAKGLHKALSDYATAAGYNPGSVSLWNEEEANQRGYGRCWMVSWEEGPHEWSINMSYQLHNSPHWYTEPYHSFDLTFVY